MVLHDVEKAVNVYRDSALINGEADNPLVTEGSSFSDSLQYDYWDHIDFISKLPIKGLYMVWSLFGDQISRMEMSRKNKL
jgi:hypothetical protein